MGEWVNTRVSKMPTNSDLLLRRMSTRTFGSCSPSTLHHAASRRWAIRGCGEQGRVVAGKVAGNRQVPWQEMHRGERRGSDSWIPNHVDGDARHPRGVMKERWWWEWPLR